MKIPKLVIEPPDPVPPINRTGGDPLKLLAFWYSRTRVVLLLILLDHLFTYFGIDTLKVLTEANPVMVWMFNMDFTLSFIFRCFLASLIFAIYWAASHYNFEWTVCLIKCGVLVNGFILSMHIHWLFSEFVLVPIMISRSIH